MNAASDPVYQRNYYQQNRARRIKQVTEQRYRMQWWIYKFLLEHTCVDCGENDPVVLEFDHVRGIKKKAICAVINYGGSLVTLQEEVAKCDVRCANCHARKTARERNTFRWRVQQQRLDGATGSAADS